MTPMDILAGFAEGLLSCLTPESWLLIPLCLAAAGAVDRAGAAAVAAGLGLSSVLAGAAAAAYGHGFDAAVMRHGVCVVLMLLGLCCISQALTKAFSLFTGGARDVFMVPGSGGGPGPTARRLFLAVLVGANWAPRIGPSMAKASAMASDARQSMLALGILIAFGVGASIAWIALGRLIRLVLRPVAGQAIEGAPGMRVFGLALLVTGAMGFWGYDLVLAHAVNPLLPRWVSRLVVAF